MTTGAACSDVLRLGAYGTGPVRDLLVSFGMELVLLDAGVEIPGSFWGDCEAGLIGARLYARPDTPLHSILHEACHWITCTPERRARMHTNAADTEDEEGASCYLQILLGALLPGFGYSRALADMDAWGYSFRLGSAQAWFERDAEDARAWLLEHGLITTEGEVRYRLRQS